MGDEKKKNQVPLKFRSFMPLTACLLCELLYTRDFSVEEGLCPKACLVGMKCQVLTLKDQEFSPTGVCFLHSTEWDQKKK